MPRCQYRTNPVLLAKLEQSWANLHSLHLGSGQGRDLSPNLDNVPGTGWHVSQDPNGITILIGGTDAGRTSGAGSRSRGHGQVR